MIPIRLVSAFGLLLLASTAAHAGSPVAASSAAPTLAGVESPLPKLELGLSEVDYALPDGQVRPTPRPIGAKARGGAHSPSLADYLKAPAPYDQFLPEAIDDHGAGYRVWF